MVSSIVPGPIDKSQYVLLSTFGCSEPICVDAFKFVQVMALSVLGWEYVFYKYSEQY